MASDKTRIVLIHGLWLSPPTSSPSRGRRRLSGYAKPDRAPLLLIAGGRDHIVLSSVVYEHLTAGA
ncbi:hypothetical protein [Mycobacterium sp.]|jgi:hypothetical protein|uniref:hypothetical protein n=1 Tax=Mycobacterium sp. TaxID=1785 RepID=UPI0033406DB3